MAIGYEDIDKLTNSQNEMLDNALKQQQDITNKQTEMNVAELERNKEDVDKDATKTNRALYTEYRKASNPYGANAEQLHSQGLGNSGYAESTQVNLYNTFQKNVTDTLNNARDLKSDFDFQISKARQTGDITLAQNALNIYNQKMQLLTQEYELKNNREQFLYQKEQNALAQSNWEKEFNYQQNRDKVSDSQWNKTFNYQQNRDKIADSQWKQSFIYQSDRDKVADNQWNKTFNYQQNRDKVADSQWEKQYQLSKKAKASSSKSSTKKSSNGSSKKKSSKTTSYVIKDDVKGNSKKTTNDTKQYTPQQIISKIQNIQGPNVAKPIKDGISGKTFANVDELLNYYGYAGRND